MKDQQKLRRAIVVAVVVIGTITLVIGIYSLGRF